MNCECCWIEVLIVCEHCTGSVWRNGREWKWRSWRLFKETQWWGLAEGMVMFCFSVSEAWSSWFVILLHLCWLGLRVGSRLAPFYIHEPNELLQWFCHDDSTINMGICIIIIIIIMHSTTLLTMALYKSFTYLLTYLLLLVLLLL